MAAILLFLLLMMVMTVVVVVVIVNSSSSNSNMQKTHCICSYAKLSQSYYELHLLSDIIAVVKI